MFMNPPPLSAKIWQEGMVVAGKRHPCDKPEYTVTVSVTVGRGLNSRIHRAAPEFLGFCRGVIQSKE